MNKFILLILGFSTYSYSMELAKPTHPLEIPDITKLVMYAIVNVHDPKDGYKQLLTSLKRFSLTNKKIHQTTYQLRCGKEKDEKEVDSATEQFNKYLIAKLVEEFQLKPSPEILASAYIGTPYALGKIRKSYAKPIDLQEKLDPKNKLVTKSRTVRTFSYGWQNSSYSKEKYTEEEMEPMRETLIKFPPSTRQLCYGLLPFMYQSWK
ncbi:hypothetical protein HYX58_05650 [Candidatus Dependentiae bacterium]|nr:hypothetical protein [Candidatus Dependentiae bacterium]